MGNHWLAIVKSPQCAWRANLCCCLFSTSTFAVRGWRKKPGECSTVAAGVSQPANTNWPKPACWVIRPTEGKRSATICGAEDGWGSSGVMDTNGRGSDDQANGSSKAVRSMKCKEARWQDVRSCASFWLLIDITEEPGCDEVTQQLLGLRANVWLVLGSSLVLLPGDAPQGLNALDCGIFYVLKGQAARNSGPVHRQADLHRPGAGQWWRGEAYDLWRRPPGGDTTSCFSVLSVHLTLTSCPCRWNLLLPVHSAAPL